MRVRALEEKQREANRKHETAARPAGKKRNDGRQEANRPRQTQAMTAGLYAALSAARHCAAGCSEKDEVWRSGKLRLYRYRSISGTPGAVPLLIVYALVNRPYMMDLEPDRSLIRGLLSRGLDVYLIDWGYPDGADRFTTLEDYLEGQLAGCVDEILKVRGLDALNLLGVCQGGVFSLCFAALHPERVRNLITMVTPVDFHTSADLLSKWARKIDVEAWVGQANVSGDVLNQLFLALMPFRLSQQKYVDLLRGPPDTSADREFHARRAMDLRQPGSGGRRFSGIRRVVLSAEPIRPGRTRNRRAERRICATSSCRS